MSDRQVKDDMIHLGGTLLVVHLRIQVNQVSRGWLWSHWSAFPSLSKSILVCGPAASGRYWRISSITVFSVWSPVTEDLHQDVHLHSQNVLFIVIHSHCVGEKQNTITIIIFRMCVRAFDF